MAFYKPGKEPENIARRLNTLFGKLDAAYPDNIIVGLYNDHKKWGETCTELYRLLGYQDIKEFLEAYGYTYGMKEKTGRPQTVDPKAIIEELQKRYPEGSPFKKAEDLFAANPDLEPFAKTVQNNATQVFGMPLGKYLLSIGLIQKKREPKPEKVEKAIKYNYCKIELLGSSRSLWCISEITGIHGGNVVEFCMNTSELSMFGIMQEITKCTEEEGPCPISNCGNVLRKVGVRESEQNRLRNLIRADAVFSTKELIRKNNAIPFSYTSKNKKETLGEPVWGVCRGLAPEMEMLLEYLTEKDEVVYSYGDLIMITPEVYELYVYKEDVSTAINDFPNVKVAAFIEDKAANKISVLYSESGVDFATSVYEAGEFGEWIYKKPPTESLSKKDFADWENMNYVFTDRNGQKMRIEGGEADE